MSVNWKRRLQFFFQQLLGTKNYLFLTALYQWYVKRHWQPDHELNFFLQQIERPGVIIDAGANLGITSLLMAKKNPDCQIIAFEPVPDNFYCLRKMIRLFGSGNIKVYNAALADTSGSLFMSQPTELGVRMHGLSRVIDWSGNDQHSLKVSALCLHELPDIQPPVTWVGMKIDVENFEWNVLKGGAEVIRKARPLIYCEIWDNPGKNRTFELLYELGYSPFVLIKGQLEPFKGQPALNFFFFPNPPATH